MALYWTNFQEKNADSLSKEEKDLYRIRDFDDPNINKAKLVNRNMLEDHRDSEGTHDVNRHRYITPKDPIWESLTENERIENGLPTKFLFKTYNSLHTFAISMALGNF